eukprot:m.67759 g.67759  ORF g.67759 m.67759 type:complete len:704 (+) comp11593_c1_seq1:153-2264(+)
MSNSTDAVACYIDGISSAVKIGRDTFDTFDGFLSQLCVEVEKRTLKNNASICSVKYIDDEDEWIQITSMDEMVAALSLFPASIQMHVKVCFNSDSDCCTDVLEVSSCCQPQSNQCCASTTVATNEKMKASSSSSLKTTTSCCSPRKFSAIPEIFLEKKQLEACRDPRVTPRGANKKNKTHSTEPLPLEENPTADQFLYSGTSLRAFTFPLGVTGGGCVSLSGDGGLRQWQIQNRVCHDAQVPDCFFALFTEPEDTDLDTTATVLMSDENYDQSGWTPAPMVTDHVVPPSSIQLLKDLPHLSTLEIEAKYPVANVNYTGLSNGLNVSMESISPCIPLDSKNSGMPVVYFTFTLENTTSSPIDATLLMSQHNMVGWDGATPIQDEIKFPGYGGNTNTALTLSGFSGIDMASTQFRKMDPQNGHVVIGTFDTDSDSTISTCLQYQSHNDLWATFSKDGSLPTSATGASSTGTTWNGAMTVKKTVNAGQSVTVSFCFLWFFANRYVNWSQKGFGINDGLSDYWLGNAYPNFWPTVPELIEYATTNKDTFLGTTRLFSDSMFTSTLPYQIVQSAAGVVAIPRSPSCMWLGDNTFYNFEGCSPTSGCCPLNCAHVLDYSVALSRLWPDLEQSQRTNDLDLQLSPNGILPSRSTVPIWLRRQWTFWPDYTDKSPDQSVCSDGEIATVIKTYREYRVGASSKWRSDKYHLC